MDYIILFLVGFFLAAALALFWMRKNKSGATKVEHFSMIEKFQSIGELTVFRAMTKEIITASDHYFGNFGQKYFRWLISNQKMAIIFQFDIDFKYDLHSSDFTIKESAESIDITMPTCLYATHIKDIKFYDEQGAKLMPWLLPSLISDVFHEGFDEETKNKLIDDAKNQASNIAQQIAKNMSSQVQNSAKTTLGMIAQNMSSKKINITFKDANPTSEETSYEVKEEKGVA